MIAKNPAQNLSNSDSSGSNSRLILWLSERNDAQLSEILHNRPDVLTPKPGSLAVVAGRLNQRASILMALDKLSWPGLCVLQAIAHLCSHACSSTVESDHIAAALADYDHPPMEDLPHHLDVFRRCALVWEPQPGQFECSPDVLTVIASTGALGSWDDATNSHKPAQWDAYADEPAARLTTKQFHTLRYAAWTWQPLPNKTQQKRVDDQCVAQGIEFVYGARKILRCVHAQPIATLKAGGIGKRELHRVARSVALDVGTVSVTLACMESVGLIAANDSSTWRGDTVYAATTAAGSWQQASIEQQWAFLIYGWLTSRYRIWRFREASSAGCYQLPATDTRMWTPHPDALAVFAPDSCVAASPVERIRVLHSLCSPPELASDSLSPSLALNAVTRWHFPLWVARKAMVAITPTTIEAQLIGLLDGLNPSTLTRNWISRSNEQMPRIAVNHHHLHEVEDPVDYLGDLCSESLPPRVEGFIIQADNTVLLPGIVAADIHNTLEDLAVLESAGIACTYRVTEQSLQRAIRLGYTTTSIEDFFSAHSIQPVPDSLHYLIADVSRSCAKLKVGPATTVLYAEDEATLAHTLHHEVAQSLMLRAVSSTVAVSPFSSEEVDRVLQSADISLTRVDASGHVETSGDEGVTVDAPPPPPATAPGVNTHAPVSGAEITARVSVLRVEEQAEQSTQVFTGDECLLALTDSVTTNTPAVVTIVDSSAVAHSIKMVPSAVGGGRVEGLETESKRLVSLQLHRITSVRVFPR